MCEWRQENFFIPCYWDCKKHFLQLIALIKWWWLQSSVYWANCNEWVTSSEQLFLLLTWRLQIAFEAMGSFINECDLKSQLPGYIAKSKWRKEIFFCHFLLRLHVRFQVWKILVECWWLQRKLCFCMFQNHCIIIMIEWKFKLNTFC